MFSFFIFYFLVKNWAENIRPTMIIFSPSRKNTTAWHPWIPNSNVRRKWGSNIKVYNNPFRPDMLDCVVTAPRFPYSQVPPHLRLLISDSSTPPFSSADFGIRDAEQVRLIKMNIFSKKPTAKGTTRSVCSRLSNSFVYFLNCSVSICKCLQLWLMKGLWVLFACGQLFIPLFLVLIFDWWRNNGSQLCCCCCGDSDRGDAIEQKRNDKRD